MILTLIFIAWNDCRAQNNVIHVEDLMAVSRSLAESGDLFLAYSYALCHYHLTTETRAKLASGMRAFDICILSRRPEETGRLMKVMVSDFAGNDKIQAALKFKYGYCLALTSEYAKSNELMSAVENNPDYRDRSLFLKAYNDLAMNDPAAASSALSKIDLTSFAYADTVSRITSKLNAGINFHRRSRIAAAAMSAVVPGLGQVYSGHHFDAIQSFTFCTILGGACYLSWKYEVLDRESRDRNYALPVVSTVVSSLFYVSNIWNAANSAARYNRYREWQHYHSILAMFDAAISDNGCFMQINLPVDF